MKYIAYEFHPGMEIVADNKFTSFVVDVVPEIQPDGYEMNLIVYKDWNPYKKIWDYHVAREIELSTLMRLYKEEFEQDGSFIGSWMDADTKERVREACIEGPDGKKATLDDKRMKKIFETYKIAKTLKV